MHVFLEVQLIRSPLQTAPGEGLNVTYQTAVHESEFVVPSSGPFMDCALAVILHCARSARRSSASTLEPLQDDPGFLIVCLQLLGKGRNNVCPHAFRCFWKSLLELRP